MVFVLTAQRIFTAINERVAEVRLSTGAVSSQTTASQLENTCKHYLDLHKVVQKVNLYFSLHMLAIQFIRCLFLCSEVFTILINTGTRPEKVTIIGVSLVILELTVLLVHCAACEACCQEAHKTVVLAHQLVTCNSPDVIIETVSLFSLATFNARVSFSVGGVFSIDMSLVTKMLSLVISYLIVMLQLTDYDVEFK
ncbi:gustatory receptor 23a [Macrosteles quadrilineatus]|uniref:gustatory receptor 23a n=1 Tax=Macrosteles quadrilineatus TaxID=74068 RepID=UPI0023E1CD2E|nr:gustatory receptor 23a [Macrosteles quadrilineatus]